MLVGGIKGDELLEGVYLYHIGLLALVDLYLVIVFAEDKRDKLVEDVLSAFLVPDFLNVFTQLLAVFRSPVGDAVTVEALRAALAVVRCIAVFL